MRKLILLFQPVMVCFIAACAFDEQETWLNEIAGSYITEYHQPYSIGWDTLIVRRSGNTLSKQYTIERRTRYQRLINGKRTPAILKRNIRQVVAGESSPSLIHTATGRRYDYDPDKKEITTGNILYYKLK